MIRWLAAFCLLCGLLAAPARAEERIEDFNSEIALAASGSVTVTETISVIAEGVRIRHGIFRDVLTTAEDGQGRRHAVGFAVVEVTRDGAPEPYGIEAIAGGRRVRIGRADTMLPPGPHRFTLRYTTDRQVRDFPAFDEFYWNVTGNGWAFPIERVRASLRLPDGANIVQTFAYTGPRGAQGGDARVIGRSATGVSFETTRALGPGEGLTIAVGFAKGVVAETTAATGALASLLLAAAAWDPRSLVAGAGTALLLLYYGLVWVRVGRDPPRGVIFPRFVPPAALSPPAMRFLGRMGYDQKAYAAAIVDLAVKGYLTISEADGVYSLHRTGRRADEAGLTAAEAGLASSLFDVRLNIDLSGDEESAKAVMQSVKALDTGLAAECEPAYFVPNTVWFFGGVAIFVATMLGIALVSGRPAMAFHALWPFCLGALFAWFLPREPLPSIAAAWQAKRRFSAMFGIAFLVVASAGGVMVFPKVWSQAIESLSLPGILAALGGAAICLLFHRLLKAPTRIGEALRDEIDGFRMFLATTEPDRLEALHPPEITPQVFERFLPYAIALDCENQWGTRFERELEAAALASGGVTISYNPGWCSGTSFDAAHPAAFSRSIGTSIGGATAAFAGGASGGGGSSGGGGGGGGGGGW